VAGPLVFISRLTKLPLLDVDGSVVGRVDDAVLAPSAGGAPPVVLGFVVVMSRRRIFIAASRVASIDGAGLRLRSAAVDLRPFQLRSGEVSATSLLDRRLGSGVVIDFAIQRADRPVGGWTVAALAIGSHGPLRRRRTARTVDWREGAELFDAGGVAQEMAALRDMHPSEQARAVRHLSDAQRQRLAEAMDDEDLADLLEELDEPEQARIIESLEVDRAAHVLEEMAPDDAADLLGELPGEERRKLLEAMDPDEAGPLRRLLLYDRHTAGGLMTPEPLIAMAGTTVAEALARMRSDEVPAAIAAQVFVVQPPGQTPTGRYLGAVGFQRLLCEAPGSTLGQCVDGDPDPIEPSLPEIEVAERLAAFNLIAVPVCDDAGRLLGAVTVDDVLDRTLPVGWRTH
jgi:CBS domain-containing protein